MKKMIIGDIKLLAMASAVLTLFIGCSKTKLVDAPYPPAIVYLTQAAHAKHSAVGVYRVPSNIYGQVIYFTVEGGKVNIPIGVSRSGVDLSGDIVVNITSEAVASGGDTEPLPASAFTLPTTVTLKSGQTNATATLSVDMDFLANSLKSVPERSYGLIVRITTPDNKQSEDFSSAIFIIDPQTILSPVADFFNYTYNDGSKTGYVINRSANSVSYTWDFGDGTPLVTDAAPAPHKYATAGTYTITLTAKSVTNQLPESVRTQTITIL